ncbi:MAG: hypothetical protein F6K19_16545 [Cyanothece sp. SIO1E1]|nr:hypothetical protein [Cyanothece sp. SIO1E1]
MALTIAYYSYELLFQFWNLDNWDEGLVLLLQLPVIIIGVSAILTLCLNFVLAKQMEKDWALIRGATILGIVLFVILSCIPFTYMGFMVFVLWVPTILSVWIGIVLFLMHTQQVMDFPGDQ